MDSADASRDGKGLGAKLRQAKHRIAELESELRGVREQLDESSATVELLTTELKRYRYAYNVGRPNCPERVSTDQLQLAFERVLLCAAPANDLNAGDAPELAATSVAPGLVGSGPSPKPPVEKKRHSHGRRNLELSNLPVEIARIDPSEVVANRELFTFIGNETSSRVGYRPASYVRLVLIRTKWVRAPLSATPEPGAETALSIEEAPAQDVARLDAEAKPPTVHIAPLPPGVLPNLMADPSAIANVIVSKYDDVLPLNRQERISTRQGFTLPRSTQCGWLGAAFLLLYRIVLAMFEESKAHAFCIATDATGAPVQKPGGCRRWHIFTFIADNGHIVFRWSNKHSGDAITTLLSGFHGHLLSDASPIYGVLYRVFGIVSVFCWAHVRRGFWRALDTDNELATEAMSIISKLFEVERDCRLVSMPERTQKRAERARPLLELFDVWVAKNQGRTDTGDPLQKAIGYYINQREGLWRFLADGRLPIHNNGAEGQLRNLALGRDNWRYFVNRTGLQWYTTFRSLIASCHLHSINPQIYLEEVLRLAPHWPANRMLLLSPKYWPQTRAALNDEQVQIIRSLWPSPAASPNTPAGESVLPSVAYQEHAA